MKKILFILVCMLMQGCASNILNETRIISDVRSAQFNDIHSQYFARPTFATVFNYKNHGDVLTYEVDQYGKAQGEYSIPLYNIDEHRKILLKFLEWDNLSKKRNEMFTKEIGKIEGVWRASKWKYIFEFYSASENKNLLSVCPKSDSFLFHCLGTDLKPLYFDVNNVKKILVDMEKVKSGKFKRTNTSVYN